MQKVFVFRFTIIILYYSIRIVCVCVCVKTLESHLLKLPHVLRRFYNPSKSNI